MVGSLVAASIVPALGLWFAPVGATRPPVDARSAFARPTAYRSSQGGVANDPVWRLGQKLFFDPSLSGSATFSCASCHRPDASWTDHQAKAIGEAGRPLAFRAPTLLNAGQIERYGWIGRFPDVEAVAFFAMTSPTNMNGSVPKVVGRLNAEPSYGAAFRAAFADGAITKHTIGVALSTYVRSITSAEAPFDRWIAGDPSAISASAARGFDLFNGRARCAECHSGWAFTDGSFHDIGLAPESEPGRGKLFPSSVKLRHAFKTPTLRNVAVRAPYMHDGSLASLDAVIDHYEKGGIARPSRAEAVHALRLTQDEKRDLAEFLKTLTSETTFARPTANVN